MTSSLQRNNIEVVPYDPLWPQFFEHEAALIQHALADNFIAVYHVGSTSIPGLLAKPKIDVIAVVKDPERAIEQLKSVGLEYKGEYSIPFHYGFSKRGNVNINLHMYEEGHPDIALNLLFRDYLRAHPTIRDEYAALKKEILLDASSNEISALGLRLYTLRKGEFIRSVLKQAGWNELRMMKCSEDAEWNTVKNFRQTYFFKPNNIDDPYTWTFNHHEHEHLLLYKGIDIVGYMHIQLWPDRRAAIRIIVIDETQRNKSFGSTFLTLCEKWLKKRGITSIHAESRLTAAAFYAKNEYLEMPFNDPDGYESSSEDIALGKML